jgi:hypothetical protein
MKEDLLADLAELFSLEAFEADMRGDFDEAARLYDIEDALHARLEKTRKHESTIVP